MSERETGLSLAISAPTEQPFAPVHWILQILLSQLRIVSDSDFVIRSFLIGD